MSQSLEHVQENNVQLYSIIQIVCVALIGAYIIDFAGFISACWLLCLNLRKVKSR